LAENTDGYRIGAQGFEVEECVSPSSQREFFPPVGEDKNGSFSRDAPCRPKEILIEDEVSPYDDLFLGKILDDLKKGSLFFIHGTCKDFARKAPKNQSTRKIGDNPLFPGLTKIGARYIFSGVIQKCTRYLFFGRPIGGVEI
jgi:hypothetical protein